MSSYKEIIRVGLRVGLVYAFALLAPCGIRANIHRNTHRYRSSFIRSGSPGVTVIVTNTDRNAPQTVISNDAGNYVFPVLIPGTYTVSAPWLQKVSYC